ncbi:MAG: UvrD-helicase domain-containing protein [Candidatus Methanomethylophilaceae archaeon]|nr:UvrD-helicase domain-containing protein [Candidatus Methanomethylophilaceae archaeon]
MSELNPSQKAIAETTEGLMVVDAGPGTGKTHTLVSRYVNILNRPDTTPSDILMMTFTRNAAAEMEERIRARLMSEAEARPSEAEEILRSADKVMAMTFDSFCYRILMDYCDLAPGTLGIDLKLTRAASLMEHETDILAYFVRFLDAYLQDHWSDYPDWAPVFYKDPSGLLSVIQSLMSQGVVPRKEGWFGYDWKKVIQGDPDALESKLLEMDAGDGSSQTELRKAMKKVNGMTRDLTSGKKVGEEAIHEAVHQDRKALFKALHDVYWSFIRSCVKDNRLTYGLVSMFAYLVLYRYPDAREHFSFRYVMVDEFQDTNVMQLMITMMVMSGPNLCAVGDWKQGIYAFRFVSIENITRFEERLRCLHGFLNETDDRVRFPIGNVTRNPLKENYRSSQAVIDRSFSTLYLGLEPEEVMAIARDVTEIVSTDDNLNENTDIRSVTVPDRDSELRAIVDAVRDYVSPGRYCIVGKGGKRAVALSDIAVISYKTRQCRDILRALTEAGIPAHYFGDVEVMATREGKLALAWMRFANDPTDPKGYVPILLDMGYSMDSIRSMREQRLPANVMEQRSKVLSRKRRITDMLSTIFSFYSIDNDISETIVSVLSTIHRNSLMTLSDLINQVEQDIMDNVTYEVDHVITGNAVTIMTMHKSKGLEFPIVIVPFLDNRVMPGTTRVKGSIRIGELWGVRSTVSVERSGDLEMLVPSWQTAIVTKVRTDPYPEQRRLMFVALSRAKQYITLIASDPSVFMIGLSREGYTSIPPADGGALGSSGTTVPRPDVGEYRHRVPKVPVHGIMLFDSIEATNEMSDSDEVGGRGKEFGTKIHDDAYNMCRGIPPENELPEHVEIGKILERAEAVSVNVMPEVDCILPLPDAGMILRGRIDLLLDCGDSMEVHDYKTDSTDRFEDEYRLQLSVYAHSASGFYGKPVRCFIDYVSRGVTVEFDPMPLEAIVQRALKMAEWGIVPTSVSINR